MTIARLLEQMKTIQTYILRFLEYEDNNEENYQNITNYLDEIEIRKDKSKLLSLLHLISNISTNHHRGSNFFNKIEQILNIIKTEINQYFTSSEIALFFYNDKRILLYFYEEKIITIDDIKQIYKKKNFSSYIVNEYFSPDETKELPTDFFEKRRRGENDNTICQLIRQDNIDEFISFVNKQSYPLNSAIEPSIYETNSFLFEKQIESYYTKMNYVTLIKYAAFFGSTQIFNYLRKNGVKLTPSLWLYAIHGQDEEIIHILEENIIQPQKNIQNIYLELFEESIKCHHIDISNYILNNYLTNNPNDFLNTYLQYYNFVFIDDTIINESTFSDLCKYDYLFLVNNLLKEKDIDINENHISKNINSYDIQYFF